MRSQPVVAALVCLGLGRPLAAQQPSAPAVDYSRQPYVVERFDQRVRYAEDGTGRTDLDVRVRIQSDAAVEALGQLEFPYDSSSQRLDVDVVRVLKPRGDTVVAPAGAVQDVSGPIAREAPVYSDLREKIVTVPGLRPGDVMEYHIHWSTHTPVAPGQFWSAVQFMRDAIVLDQRLALDVPRAKHVTVRTAGMDQPAVADSGDRRTYSWSRANLQVDTTGGGVRRGSAAASMPPEVQFTTFRSWQDVGRWYAALERDREAVTPRIRAIADSLVRGQTSLLDSIAAVYGYVSSEFRYVSLSFGVGHYRPHAASEVLANQYGDCKDKHALLAALLRAVGVPSGPALISSEEDVDSTVPSPQQFNHVITFVPAGRDTLWLDATPGVAPFRLLLSPLRGRSALVVPLEGAARLSRTPSEPPFPEFYHVDVEGELSDAGRLSATYRHTFRGDAEVLMRAVFRAAPGDRPDMMGREMARGERLTGTVSATHGGDPTATREPFEFDFRLERADAVRWTREGTRYALPLPSLTVPDADTAAAADTTLLPKGEQAEHLRLALPTGVTVELPAPVSTSREFGRYASSYRLVGRTLEVHRQLTFMQSRVPPARAADVVAFRGAVRDDEDQEVTLRRADVPAVAPADVDVAALYQSGVNAYQRRDLRTAIRTLRVVVTRNPQHDAAWNELGRAYLDLRQLDSAEACFRRQIAVNPNDHYSYNNLGLALWRSHRNPEAVEAFRHQIQVNPLDQYAHGNLGELALEMHQDTLAVAELRLAVGVSPDNAGTHASLGRAYAATGLPDAAVAEFDRAIALNPSGQVLNSAAYALAEHSVRLDRAEQYARSAVDSAEAPLRDITLDDAGPLEMIAVMNLGHIWDTMGWIFFQRGDYAGAERYLRAAWLANPDNGVIADHLGQTYERLGRSADAMHADAVAASATPPVPEARQRLVALAGGPARADRLMQDAVHGGRQAGRTVRIGHATRISASGEVQLLLGPGPRVEDIRFDAAPEALRPLADAIRAAGPSFPYAFPYSSRIHFPLRGILACSPASGCSIVLTQLPTSGSFTQVIRVPTPR